MEHKKKYKRDYKGEYKYYQSSPLQKYRRAGRNAARRKMLALGRVRKYSSTDVHHLDKNTWNNGLRNLRPLNKHINRSIK